SARYTRRVRARNAPEHYAVQHRTQLASPVGASEDAAHARHATIVRAGIACRPPSPISAGRRCLAGLLTASSLLLSNVGDGRDTRPAPQCGRGGTASPL